MRAQDEEPAIAEQRAIAARLLDPKPRSRRQEEELLHDAERLAELVLVGLDAA